MLLVAPVVGELATCVGLFGRMVAVGGFIAHVKPALAGASERQIRRATIAGGVIGLVISLSVVVLSASIAKLTS
jgi:hypothetical protein